jgi:hypothetical protein
MCSSCIGTLIMRPEVISHELNHVMWRELPSSALQDGLLGKRSKDNQYS